MVKIHAPKYIAPRKKKRLEWYCEQLCLELLKKDVLTPNDESWYWSCIKAKKEEYKPNWMKQYLDKCAHEKWDWLITFFKYDEEKNIWKKLETKELVD